MAGRRGCGEDSIYFDHSRECRDPETHRHCPGRWRGVVSLKPTRPPNSTSPASSATAWTGMPSRPAVRHTSDGSPDGSAAANASSRRVWSGKASS